MFCDVSKDGPIFFFIKVTLVVLSCSSLGKNTDDFSKNCQWCHHNFLCIVISSREGGRILPKKKKKNKKIHMLLNQ